MRNLDFKEIVATSILTFLVVLFCGKLFKPSLVESSHSKVSTKKQPPNFTDFRLAFEIAKNKSQAVQLSPAKQNSLTTIQKIVQIEARRLYDQIQNPETLDQQITQRARAFNNEQLNELAQITMNSSLDPDERIVAVYFLKKAGTHAHKQLEEVFFKDFSLQDAVPSAHSPQSAQIQVEHSLRTTALIAIEKNIQLSQGHLKLRRFQKIKDTYLSSLLRVVEIGVHMKQPMLKQFLDRSITQENL